MVLLLWVYWSSLSSANGPSVPSVPSLVAYAITTERQRWGELRHTPCDGVELPAAASIGAFEGRTVPLLRTLGHREELATLANQLNLTGAAAELGVFRGEFSEKNRARWRGCMSCKWI